MKKQFLLFSLTVLYFGASYGMLPKIVKRCFSSNFSLKKEALLCCNTFSKRQLPIAFVVKDESYGYRVPLGIIGKLNKDFDGIKTVKNRALYGEFHLGEIITAITALGHNFAYDDSLGNYKDPLHNMCEYMFDDFLKEMRLYEYALPITGHFFCEYFSGLEDCIKDGIKNLGDEFHQFKLLKYIGENYFNIAKGTKLTDDKYYINLPINASKSQQQCPGKSFKQACRLYNLAYSQKMFIIATQYYSVTDSKINDRDRFMIAIGDVFSGEKNIVRSAYNNLKAVELMLFYAKRYYSNVGRLSDNNEKKCHKTDQKICDKNYRVGDINSYIKEIDGYLAHVSGMANFIAENEESLNFVIKIDKDDKIDDL